MSTFLIVNSRELFGRLNRPCHRLARRLDTCVAKKKVEYPVLYSSLLDDNLKYPCKKKAIRYFDCVDERITFQLYKIAEVKCRDEVANCLASGNPRMCRSDRQVQLCAAKHFISDDL
eukprot:TRINITY_DN3633_c0_g1_i2.p1 TRINITY_DN3633_c0_g1~~TRINITY_DN3633_c0_g1_i2.p1  ORF type:complete len:117 (+),score=26.25 TRINITY_DN3633_c0_g1_i2:132-482(+)